LNTSTITCDSSPESSFGPCRLKTFVGLPTPEAGVCMSIAPGSGYSFFANVHGCPEVSSLPSTPPGGAPLTALDVNLYPTSPPCSFDVQACECPGSPCTPDDVHVAVSGNTVEYSVQTTSCAAAAAAVTGLALLDAETAAAKLASANSSVFEGVAVSFVDSPSATGCTTPSAPTPTPTPTPISPAPTPPVAVTGQVRQSVTFAISTQQYAGVIKEAYDMGYASFLGIYDDLSNSLVSGCLLTGTASPARRSSTVSYVARVISNLLSAATASSRSANGASDLQASINAVIHAAYPNQSIPTALVTGISNVSVTIHVDPLSPVVHAGYATMTQSAAFASTVAYSGDIEMAYNKGYGKSLGIYSTVSRRRVGYKPGTNVVGYQTARRTGSSISWISVLHCAAARSAQTLAASRDLALLQDSIQEVINSEYSSLGPAAQATSLGTPSSQFAFCDSSSSSGLSGAAIAGIVIGSVAGCTVLLIVVIYRVLGPKSGHSKDSKQTAHAIETTQNGVELQNSTEKKVKVCDNDESDESFRVESQDVSFKVDAVNTRDVATEERLDGVIMGI